MMNRLKKTVEKLYDKKVDSIGVSLFRITYCMIFFMEILQFKHFQHLMFDYLPYVQEFEIDFGPILFVWLIVVFCLIIGLFTKISAIINYILTLTFFATISSYEYHMFYAYLGLNFLLIFIPVNKSLSLDRLIERVKYSTSKYTHSPDTKVSVLAYYVPLFIGIALVYFDSVIFKVGSPYWMKGIGMWAPSVFPQFNHYGNSFVLNIKWLALLLGYITLIFEAILIFFFWYKPFRWPFLLIGWGLHLGILIFFPIPWFALSVFFLYFLLVPIYVWKKIGRLFKSKKSSLAFIYDGDCPLCNRTRIVISSFDIFNKIQFITIGEAIKKLPEIAKIPYETLIENIHSITPKGKIYKGVDTYLQVLIRMIYTAPIGFLLYFPGIYHIAQFFYKKIAVNRLRYPCTDEECAIPQLHSFPNEGYKLFRNYSLKKFKVTVITYAFLLVILMQLCVSYHSGIIVDIRKKTGIDKTFPGKLLSGVTGKIGYFSKIFFGITNHGLFMDAHMKGYNHIVAIQYVDEHNNKTWLPIINENGQPGRYLLGSNWAKWSFRVNGPSIDSSLLERGIRDFTAFWLHEQNKLNGDRKFIILVKKIDVPAHWEKDFLKKQMEKPWIEAGHCEWTDKRFFYKLEKEIEKI